MVGGGFGGLYAARALRRAPAAVTLADRSNHHLFQPLLYQVATAALSPANIAVALRRVLRRQRNVSVVMAEAVAVDLRRKRVELQGGALDYDYLVLATGATHSYFGHDDWAAHAPGLKTLDDALEIRRRMLLSYEAAERETDPDRREALLTFVVVGGGPTGVELAGALAEIARHVLLRDFRRIDPAAARVVLVEAGPRLLPAFPADLSQAALERLQRMGVQVRLGIAVTGIDGRGVALGAERIESRCVLWAAGVQASPLARSLGVPLDRAGRVPVEPDLSVPGAPEVFAIGDLAAMKMPDGRPVPGVAPAAIQSGRHAARNIRRLLRGEKTEPFRYLDKGSLATIGRAAAVAQIGRLHLSGFIAWVLWLVVHILTLIGFRNRFIVLIEWAVVYLRYERGARLITGGAQPRLSDRC
ncbi:MAG: NAD(P)/FAD-dependent oxidoreductase [Deltaproteobacteria bacterium]|nr:MAG: NAD(P)/FAD-dependent oxidoreductase [Deltaproteobacteria bacterium]